MDKRANNGGARKGAGRKKDSGISYIIRKHCESFITELLSDEVVKAKAMSDVQTKMFEDEDDYLYLIESNGLCKIGYTSNIKKRIKHYKVHNAGMKVLYIYKGADCFNLESMFHVRYAEQNIQGEWYCLEDRDIINIISECTSYLIN